jgi:serine/threonine protein kinase
MDLTQPLTRDRWLGRTLAGRYDVESVLGRGGFGAVYSATQQPLGRTVAVKVLLPGSAASETDRRRFVREAESLSRLSHPNIVQLIDFGTTEEGDAYLVSEFVRGVPLDRLLRDEGPLAPQRVLSLAEQLLSALSEAHAHGIVHRDLKPGNVLVGRLMDGREQLKLIDFGIVRVDDARSPTLTAATQIVGTPRYMAPELWLGQPADPRSDLYSLGLLLHELLTGQRAIVGDVVECRDAHLSQPPPALPETVPQNLRRAIAWCLAKNRRERPASAARLAESLRDQGVVSESAPTETAAGRSETTTRPRPWAIGAGIVLLLVIGVAIARSHSSGDSVVAPTVGHVVPPPTSLDSPSAPAPHTAHRPTPREPRPPVLGAAVLAQAPRPAPAVVTSRDPTPLRPPSRAASINRRWYDTEDPLKARAPATLEQLQTLSWDVEVLSPRPAKLFLPGGDTAPTLPYRVTRTVYGGDVKLVARSPGFRDEAVVLSATTPAGPVRIVMKPHRNPQVRPRRDPIPTALDEPL